MSTSVVYHRQKELPRSDLSVSEGNILIVTHQKDFYFRSLFSALMIEQRNAVNFCESTTEALQICKEEEVDLIIIDWDFHDFASEDRLYWESKNPTCALELVQSLHADLPREECPFILVLDRKKRVKSKTKTFESYSDPGKKIHETIAYLFQCEDKYGKLYCHSIGHYGMQAVLHDIVHILLGDPDPLFTEKEDDEEDLPSDMSQRFFRVIEEHL